jgi:hypothetical protein
VTSGWLVEIRRRGESDGSVIVAQMLVARAQARLDAQHRGAEAAELKALALLGADAAALGVLVAANEALYQLWWAVASGFGLAGLLLLATVWPQKLDAGPSVRTFYETFGNGTPLDVSRQMLAELIVTIDANERIARARKLDGLVKASLILIVLSSAGAIPIALLG